MTEHLAIAAEAITRRRFTGGLAAAFIGGALQTACSSGEPSYEALVASTWRAADRAPSHGTALLRELVRYATLAANSHNTQPWLFQIEPEEIVVLPDFERRVLAVDPDDHHLYASLGCATENLVVAAAAHGLHANVTTDEHAIRIRLEPGSPADSPLFYAIPQRQSTRAAYDGRPVPPEQLAALEAAARDDGVSVQLLTAERDLETILEYVVEGNTAQMRDEAFVTELESWLRFSESSAVRYRDGLYSASSGNPTAPEWIGRIVFDFAFRVSSENDKYREQLRSSAGVIAFISAEDNKRSWITVGRCCQRFALQATALGLRQAFINQPVEVPEVRAQLADYLGTGDRRPDLLLRFGYGPELPRSLRRPVDDVLI